MTISRCFKACLPASNVPNHIVCDTRTRDNKTAGSLCDGEEPCMNLEDFRASP